MTTRYAIALAGALLGAITGVVVEGFLGRSPLLFALPGIGALLAQAWGVRTGRIASAEEHYRPTTLFSQQDRRLK